MNKKGFTLTELLIVVAIIAVLVAVAIPVFSNQLEKTRRVADMYTARSIASVLTMGVNDGTVVFPDNRNHCGIWVAIWYDKDRKPKGYTATDMQNTTHFCGADKNITINGTTNKADWNKKNQDVENLLAQSGIDADSLKIKCRKSSRSVGWDWIVISAGYEKNQFYTHIYSGLQKDTASSELSEHPIGSSAIEKEMGMKPLS